MFPIPSEQRLTLAKIAKYWAGYITPRVDPRELLDILVKAWWQNDLIATGASRVDILRSLYLYEHDYGLVRFISPEFPQGQRNVQSSWDYTGKEVPQPQVPLPNASLQTWTEENCILAFEAIARWWDGRMFLLPKVGALETTQAEFARWVGSQGFKRPNFWASSTQREQPSSRRRIPKAKAEGLAQDYIRRAKQERRAPTQKEFVEEIHDAGWRGNRDVVRRAYKDAAKLMDVQVKQGPPQKEQG
jgi:hypothetical protein